MLFKFIAKLVGKPIKVSDVGISQQYKTYTSDYKQYAPPVITNWNGYTELI